MLGEAKGKPDPAAVAEVRRRYDIEQLTALRNPPPVHDHAARLTLDIYLHTVRLAIVQKLTDPGRGLRSVWLTSHSGDRGDRYGFDGATRRAEGQTRHAPARPGPRCRQSCCAGRERAYEVVVGDLEEPETLDDAFEGVDVLWLLTPSLGARAVDGLQRGERRAVRRRSSTSCATRPSRPPTTRPTGTAACTPKSRTPVKASGIPWTILRPHYYMQNLLSSAGSVASDGMLYMNMGDAAGGDDRRPRRRSCSRPG